MAGDQEHPAVTRFREYLRIKSVHPYPDYLNCIRWIRNQAEEVGLKFNILEFSENQMQCRTVDGDQDHGSPFVIWLTWEGKDQSLPSILLNSHIDVVPVDEEKWTQDPFGAYKDAQGNIYARGSQDMKCVGVQYLEAIRNLKKEGFVPLRNVYVSFVPDEEIGGLNGMYLFINSAEFQKLNIGFGLDEGIANPGESFDVFYAERIIWQFKFTARGDTGHASFLHENTAAEKIQKVIERMLDLRSKEKERMALNSLHIGQVTSINLTEVSGGIQPNVVPPEISVGFDMRITPTSWKLSDVDRILKEICTDAGPEVSIDFSTKLGEASVTQLDSSNPWWTSFKAATDSMGMKLNELIFPGGTDINYLRGLNIPALGFSPMNHTPILLHDHDEFLNENVFLKGIGIYENIFKYIFNVPPQQQP